MADSSGSIFRGRDGRPRAAWRLPAVQVPFWAAFVAYNFVALPAIRDRLPDRGPGLLLSRRLNFPTAALAWACLRVAARCVDRRPLSGFGLRLDRRWAGRLLAGVAVGFGASALPFLASWLAGDVRFIAEARSLVPGVGFAAAIASAAISTLFTGFTEEGMTRGHAMRNLAEGLRGVLGPGSPVAALAVVALPAAGFAICHAVNGESWIRFTPLYLSAGIIAGCIFHVTGDLALPIGLHAGWDFSRMFALNDQSDCPLIRLDWARSRSIPAPNDLAYVPILMALVAAWWAWKIGRPGFRSPLETDPGPGPGRATRGG